MVQHFSVPLYSARLVSNHVSISAPELHSIELHLADNKLFEDKYNIEIGIQMEERNNGAVAVVEKIKQHDFRTNKICKQKAMLVNN